MRETNWTAIVPVKEPKRAKSRLGPQLERWRPDLAAAFAVDTIAALLAASRVQSVIVVGGQGLPGAWLDHPRVRTLPDPGNLNTAAGNGIAWARRHRPGVGILVLTADLPAATGAAIDRLLTGVHDGGPRVLADQERVGSTGLLLGPGTLMTPAFGADSFDRHRAAGAMAVEANEIDGLRRDVDTATQLAEAVKLGVGRQTQSVLDEISDDRR